MRRCLLSIILAFAIFNTSVSHAAPFGCSLLKAAVNRMRGIETEVRNYWDQEYLARVEHRLSNEMLKRLYPGGYVPISQRTFVQRTAGWAKLTLVSPKEWARIAFLPFFVIGEGLYKVSDVMDQKHEGGWARAGKALFVPYAVMRKNSFSALGYAIIIVLAYAIAASESYMDDYDYHRAVVIEDVAPTELIAVISDQNAMTKEQMDKLTAGLQNQYDGRIKKEQIVRVIASNAKELFERLGALRAQGRIRDVHLMMHGRPGAFGVEDAGGKIQIVDLKSLEKFEPDIAKLPDDLFTSNARISMYSCNLATGSEGDAFMKKFGCLMLRNGGTLLGPSRLLRPMSRDDKVGTFTLEGTANYAKDNGISAAMVNYNFTLYLVTMMSLPGLAVTLFSGGLNEPTVKVYDVPPNSAVIPPPRE